MKDQLIRYIDLLFAGAPDATDIKEEIQQNTLDRYDDLITQGKNPQAAYSLAIAGIGDVNEILSGISNTTLTDIPISQSVMPNTKKTFSKKLLRAIGICLYIISPIPLFLLENSLGLCGLLVIAAVATAFIIISSNPTPKSELTEQPKKSESKLCKLVSSAIWIVGVVAYFIISATTNAWGITWIIFPLTGSVEGLVNACLDYAGVE